MRKNSRKEAEQYSEENFKKKFMDFVKKISLPSSQVSLQTPLDRKGR